MVFTEACQSKLDPEGFANTFVGYLQDATYEEIVLCSVWKESKHKKMTIIANDKIIAIDELDLTGTKEKADTKP